MELLGQAYVWIQHWIILRNWLHWSLQIEILSADCWHLLCHQLALLSLMEMDYMCLWRKFSLLCIFRTQGFVTRIHYHSILGTGGQPNGKRSEVNIIRQIKLSTSLDPSFWTFSLIAIFKFTNSLILLITTFVFFFYSLMYFWGNMFYNSF